MTAARFQLGQIVATTGAINAVSDARQSPFDFIRRHISGDWGNLDAEDKQSNEDAILHGDRLLSSYFTNNGIEIWLITEADRSSTCILLPEEY